MSQARVVFLGRLAGLRKSIEIDAVTDRALTEREHNEIARILRNGLAVVGFAALEDYIKTRCGEILSSIGSTGVPFSALPEKIQHATTMQAISALNYQLNVKDNANKLSYIQSHTKKIASTANTTYELTPHAFAYDKPNVSDEMIKNILGCFCIEDPWGNMSNISSLLGLTALPLKESYRNAFYRRHRAAHVPSEDTPQVDIAQFVKEAAGIAISFDCLLSKSLNFIKANDSVYLAGKKHPNSSLCKFRTIRFVSKVWKEFPPESIRSIKNDSDLNRLIGQASRRAISKGEFLAVFDQHGNLNNWDCY